MTNNTLNDDLLTYVNVQEQLEAGRTVFNSDEVKALLSIIDHLNGPLPRIKNPLGAFFTDIVSRITGLNEEAVRWKQWLTDHYSHLWKVHYTYNEGSTKMLEVFVVANVAEDAQALAQIWGDETSEEEDKAIITKIELVDWGVLFSSKRYIVRPTPPPHG